jgi:hypothetical protein
MPFRLSRLACAFLFCAASSAFSVEWFVSNPSGMAVERSPSRNAALRSEWALSVEPKEASSLPAILKPFYEEPLTIELRVLYRQRKALRRQWIFRDGGDMTRLNASLPDVWTTPASAPGSIPGEPHDRLPFIEVYSDGRLLTEFHQITPQGERYRTVFTYNENGLLLKSETTFGGKKLWDDIYKYTRNGGLRGVERDYSGTMAGAPSGGPVSVFFSPPGSRFISPESPYDQALRNGALREVFNISGVKVLYSTDDLGKVLSEERQDAEGKIVAELTNTWDESRLMSIAWKTEKASGLVEFEYDEDGGRVAERDHRGGVLERSVTRDGTRETEELYRNGRPILRAVYEDGRKVSEERF